MLRLAKPYPAGRDVENRASVTQREMEMESGIREDRGKGGGGVQGRPQREGRAPYAFGVSTEKLQTCETVVEELAGSGVQRWQEDKGPQALFFTF